MRKNLTIKCESIQKNEMNVGLCFQDVMKAYLSFFGKDFSIPLLKAFNFRYRKAAEGEKKLGDKISPNYDILSLYAEYGLKIRRADTPDVFDYIALLKMNVDRGLPTIIHYDCYYVPYDPFYRQNHNGHQALVSGYDEEKKVFIIADPYWEKVEQEVDYETLESASLFYYEISGVENYATGDVRTALINHFKQLSRDGYFENLETFMADFIERFDPDAEYMEKNNPYLRYNSVLFRNVQEIIKSRMLFLLYLEHALSRQFYDNVFELLFHAESVKAHWITFFNLLIKDGCAGYKPANWVKMGERLKKIAASEKALFAEVERTQKQAKPKAQRLTLSKVGTPKNFVYVPLNEYCNNKGFSLVTNPVIKPDITGNGEYIKIPERNIEFVQGFDGTTFRADFDAQRDNVICNGQKIALNFENRFTGFAALVVTEWGVYFGTFYLETEEGELIAVTNRYYDLSDSGEAESLPIGSSYLIRRIKDERFREVACANAYNIFFSVPARIKSIRLPQCENLHLVALTLFSEPINK